MDPFWRVLAYPGSLPARRGLAQHMRRWADARGELISDSLALRIAEREGRIAPMLRLRDSIMQRLRWNGKTWAGELAPYVDVEDSFAYGLVAKIYVSGDLVPTVLARATTIAPVQHLVVRAPLESLQRILACVELLQLCSLSLSNFGELIGDREAVMLARCEHLVGLRFLRLDGNNIGAEGVEALTASPVFAGAAYVDLANNPEDPTPTAYDVDGEYFGHRPPLAEKLENIHGPRPWLALPTDPKRWPPRMTDLAVTDEAEPLPEYVMGPVGLHTMLDLCLPSHDGPSEPAPAWVDAQVETFAREIAEAYATKRDGKLSTSPSQIVRVANDKALVVFELMLWLPAQSGSDSYEHRIFCGRADLDIARRIVKPLRTELRQALDLTEHEVDWADNPFDRRAHLQRVAKRFIGRI